MPPPSAEARRAVRPGCWPSSAWSTKPNLLHIPCPNGHELETPLDMIGQRAMCPHCGVEFRLKREKSVEYLRQQEIHRSPPGQVLVSTGDLAASFVGVVLVAMIVMQLDRLVEQNFCRTIAIRTNRRRNRRARKPIVAPPTSRQRRWPGGCGSRWPPCCGARAGCSPRRRSSTIGRANRAACCWHSGGPCLPACCCCRPCDGRSGTPNWCRCASTFTAMNVTLPVGHDAHHRGQRHLAAEHGAVVGVSGRRSLLLGEPISRSERMPLVIGGVGLAIILWFELRGPGPGGRAARFGLGHYLCRRRAVAAALRDQDTVWMVAVAIWPRPRSSFPTWSIWTSGPASGSCPCWPASALFQMATAVRLLRPRAASRSRRRKPPASVCWSRCCCRVWVYLVWDEVPAPSTLVGGGLILPGLVLRYAVPLVARSAKTRRATRYERARSRRPRNQVAAQPAHQAAHFEHADRGEHLRRRQLAGGHHVVDRRSARW